MSRKDSNVFPYIFSLVAVQRQYPMKKPTLFVISAPSGAGKSTLVDALRRRFPDLRYSISCTTRAPRAGEIHGIHYHFLTKDRFDELAQSGGFIEWKEVHGNMYGTPAGPVREALQQGASMILDIDVQGAGEVFKAIPDAVGIFISAPDMSTLEQRLRQRGSDSEESIKIRLRNAQREMELARLFRYHIVNDNLETTINDLAEIIRNESGI